MTDIEDGAAGVMPDGFHLEPTYEHLVAETGYDPELGATEGYAAVAQPENGTPEPAGLLVHPVVSE